MQLAAAKDPVSGQGARAGAAAYRVLNTSLQDSKHELLSTGF